MDLTVQQQDFLKHYIDPKSDTWGNAYKSALKAKYSEEYSQNITGQMPTWLSENISDDKLTRKAYKNLDLALDGGLDDPEKGGKPIQMRATELTLKGLQKTKWSDRVEVTGKDGKDLPAPILGYVQSNNSPTEDNSTK